MLKGKGVPPDGHHLSFKESHAKVRLQVNLFPVTKSKNNQNVMRRCGVNHTRWGNYAYMGHLLVTWVIKRRCLDLSLRDNKQISSSLSKKTKLSQIIHHIHRIKTSRNKMG